MVASRSGAMCSGSNSAASGPHTEVSRCSAGVSTVMGVCAGMAYRSPITVSSKGYRLNPGAVGHSRSASSSTWRM